MGTLEEATGPKPHDVGSAALRPIDSIAMGCLGVTLLVWIFLDVATGRGHWSAGETYWLFENNLQWLNDPAVLLAVGFSPPLAGLVMGIVALARRRRGAPRWPGILATALSPVVAITGLLIAFLIEVRHVT